MRSDPKPGEKTDPLAEPMHDADPPEDEKEALEEEGEPFDGNFA